MTKWEDYFELSVITPEDKQYTSSQWWHMSLKIKSTGESIGVYRDRKYAVKQAKYKFKKLVKQVEKALLG